MRRFRGSGSSGGGSNVVGVVFAALWYVACLACSSRAPTLPFSRLHKLNTNVVPT